MYDAAVSGTAVPALPPFCRHKLLCAGRSLSGLRLKWVGGGVLPRCLARQCPLPPYSLPAHAVVYWYVSLPLEIMFEKGRGGRWYDSAVSSTAVPPPPSLLVECMMPRCLAPPCPLLSFLPPHAVVRGLGLFLEFTFEVGRRGGVYDAAASGTPEPAPSLLAAGT